MAKELGEGDRLIAVTTPGQTGRQWRVGFGEVGEAIRSITVGRLPGPMGFYLTAQIIFEDRRPDIVIPLHMAEAFEIQYGD